MTATLQTNGIATLLVVYMALELSQSKWKVCFECGERRRTVNVSGGDWERLKQEIETARQRLKAGSQALVKSCYEAGRDGFWLHRLLTSWGVENVVVDAASIEVSRRARRSKTDRLDVEQLVAKLRAYHGGERRVWRVVRVPDEQAEAGRHLHRELEQLKAERTRHGNRIKSLLFAQGVQLARWVKQAAWAASLQGLCTPLGQPLSADLRGQLERERERLEMVQRQIVAIEREQQARLKTAKDGALAQVNALQRLKALGPVGSWTFVHEFFAWRQLRNGKQVGALAGLTGTPYDSGQMRREQGISKAGNRRVRSLAVEIAWLWLRHQPASRLSKWFQERFGTAGRRHRRVGIVALARKLLVALWRYLTTGVIPEGAVLKEIKTSKTRTAAA